MSPGAENSIRQIFQSTNRNIIHICFSQSYQHTPNCLTEIGVQINFITECVSTLFVHNIVNSFDDYRSVSIVGMSSYIMKDIKDNEQNDTWASHAQ